MDEIRDFHPLVAKWLDENGYDYQHEVTIKGLRVDFLAKHRETGEFMLVEAKLRVKKPDRFRATMAQAMHYEEEFDKKATAAVAVPADEVQESYPRLCKRFNIRLIPIEVQRKKPKAHDPPVATPLTNKQLVQKPQYYPYYPHQYTQQPAPQKHIDMRPWYEKHMTLWVSIFLINCGCCAFFTLPGGVSSFKITASEIKGALLLFGSNSFLALLLYLLVKQRNAK